MASCAALVTGCILVACPPCVNRVRRKIQGSMFLQSQHNRVRPHFLGSHISQWFGCAPVGGHLTVAHAQGRSCLFRFAPKMTIQGLLLVLQGSRKACFDGFHDSTVISSSIVQSREILVSKNTRQLLIC
ncbi:Phosphoinositide phosphatase SAC6 [Zea mays]|jgi:hypothetical protein|uniref:Phosphoinositide phosphatase SAC6 n=1 Tax=Zea mays TaxID=4577 RepID=A0A1D6HAH6_MAIZE|nr:Phosphoinositide phosphatase SAC6 [Zea mays]